MDLTRVSRRKAFLVHLGLSCAIFGGLVALMVFYWFPGTLFTVDGGWQGIRIIAAVDIVLGPALTLLFFRPQKKRHRELMIDLSLIAAVQVAALSWGIWTVYSQRTVALSFYVDRFYSVTQPMLDESAEKIGFLGRTPIDPRSLSDASPALVYVPRLSGEARDQYVKELFQGMPIAYARSDFYQRLPLQDDSLAGLQISEETREQLKKDEPQLMARLEEEVAALEAEGTTPQVYLYEARYANALVVLDPRQGGRIAAILPY